VGDLVDKIKGKTKQIERLITGQRERVRDAEGQSPRRRQRSPKHRSQNRRSPKAAAEET
jgi:hypothetical protein